MPEQTGRPAHIQRCTYAEIRGGHQFQCKHADPHPSDAKGHDLGIDARFHAPLHTMHPEKLAALLRDQVALTDHLQRRLDDMQAIALALANGWAGSSTYGAWELPAAAADWLRTYAPTSAETLGLDA